MSFRSLPGRRAFACGLLSLGALSACATDELTGPSAAATPPAAPSLAVAAASGAVTAPELPRATVNTALVAPTGRTLQVKAGGNLQKAIDSARTGDVIVLQAGATFSGNFRLPKKTGTGWVTIRTSTPDAKLPAPGTRIRTSQANLLPKVVTPNGNPAIATYNGAHHYRLIGLEIMAASKVTSVGALVKLGSGSTSTQNTLSQVPTHLVIDRSYIHGRSGMALKRCVELNSAHTAVIDSHLSQCHSKTQDSQAIAGWNGPGPYLIQNNHLAGAAENVIFGGADPANEALMPADITIRGNHITKPLSWKGVWLVKNLVELKVGRRVLIEGNVLENSWADGQTGFAMLLKTAVGSKAKAWGRTEHVTVRGNIIRNSVAGINVAGRDGSSGLLTRHVRIEHNLLENVGVSNGTKNGRLIQVTGTVHGLQIERNTMLHHASTPSLAVTVAKGTLANGFVFRDNVVTRGSYGVKGDGTAEGTASLNKMFPGHLFAGNAIIGGKASSYPAGNLFPATRAAAGFVNASSGDYRLASSSTLKGRASDGTDPGADMGLVQALTAGVQR